jgi:hypothetical protein
MVAYDVPDDLIVDRMPQSESADNWFRDPMLIRRLGDDWLRAATAPIITVPSAVLPVKGSPGLNILVNHAHPDAARIRIQAIANFKLDARPLD